MYIVPCLPEYMSQLTTPILEGVPEPVWQVPHEFILKNDDQNEVKVQIGTWIRLTPMNFKMPPSHIYIVKSILMNTIGNEKSSCVSMSS